MKRFSLNTKRAAKVLALTLAAAMVVPNVPAQKLKAADDGAVELPEVIASNSFDSASGLTAGDTKGKALKFTSTIATETFVKLNASGAATEEEYQSKDNVPEKDADGNLVYEDVDVTPTIVRSGAVKGGALSLKKQVSAVKYPSAAPDTANEIQSAKTYYSGVQIANPFTAYRDDLFDPSRFTFDNVADTATEEYRGESKEALGWEYDSTTPLYELKNRYTAPEAKAGVTISFWAKVPYDEKAEAAADTNFFEFSNTESLIYSTDDMAKVWVAYQYDKAVEAGTVDDKDSPFYIGEVTTATVTAVNSNCAADFKAQTGADFDEDGDNQFTYLKDQGAFVKWNPKAAESDAAIAKEAEGQYKVYCVSSITTTSTAANKEIVVEAGLQDADGNDLYYHLKWSDTVFADGVAGSYYEQFRPTDNAPVGVARIISGATGYLYMATDEIYYRRDDNQTFKTGVVTNELSSTYGTLQNGEANTWANIKNPEIAETLSDDPEDTWHFYTITITDDWFQLYMDGEACDPSKAAITSGNTFNAGSGMYRPDGVWAPGNNQRSDFQKLNNDDWSGSIYGQIFGTTVMDYITDPNTKLYIGGKTQETAEGTLIDEMRFYKEVMSAEQVAYDYSVRVHDLDPASVPAAVKTVEFDSDSDIVAVDGTTGKAIKFTDETATKSFVLIGGTATGEGVLYGDVNKSGQPDTDDALVILGHVAGNSITGDDLLAIADVNKSGQPDTDDALAILGHVAGSALITDKYGAGETYDSKDKVPETAAGQIVYEDIDVTPEIVEDETQGKVLELKDQVKAVKYPSAAPNEENEIQSEKTYYSGVQIANPFTAYREVLFDASRFTFENAASTATEVTRKVISTATDGWEYDSTNATWPELKNRFSAPEAKAGVTISFWAQVPYDEKTDTAAVTNFFEFSNTESLVYSTDDMAKVWIADMYDKAVEAGTVNNADSPFYIGEVTTATVTAVDSNCASDYAAQTGDEFAAGTNDQFTYLKGQGAFVKWNPAAAESEAAIAKSAEGQYKVYCVNGISDSSLASSKEIVVETGLKNAAGKDLYYHLKGSDTVYAEGAEGSNYVKYRPTDDAPVGAARTIAGATGQLYMATNQTLYMRDNNAAFKTGVDVNELSSNYGTVQNGEANTYAGVINSEVAETAEDEAWHYYTITITDEWFQVYVDGVACDPAKSVAWNGNTFNLGSSMYRPDGVWVNSNGRSDFQKLNNDDWYGSIYGQLFGTSVMDYITDANTKLYIGGKTQNTVAGTRVDSFAFYTVALDEAQVAAEYAERAGN